MKKIKTLLWILILSIIPTMVHAEEYSEEFKKITTDGTLQLPLIDLRNEDIPSDREYDYIWTAANIYFNNIGITNDYIIESNLQIDDKICNQEGSQTSCIYTYKLDVMDISLENKKTGEVETHTVHLKFAKTDETAKKEVEEFAKKVQTRQTDSVAGLYELKDLNLVNYLVTKGKKNHVENERFIPAEEFNFVPEVIELTKNTPFTILVDARAGDANDLYTYSYGYAVISYNDTIYAYKEYAGAFQKQVLYIQDTTEDTQEAYIEAAQKRLQDYMPNEDITVTYGGKITEIEQPQDINIQGSDDNYYKIVINGDTERYFVFQKKKLEEMKTPEYQNQDTKTGIEIATTDTSVPLDTVITANIIQEETEEHKQIEEKMQTDIFQAVEISLYSKNASTYIHKLESGKFKVKIPIVNEKLKNKELYAYYFQSDNTIEEYPITIDQSGNAVFETSHFSTYIISEKINLSKDTTPVPQTSDNLLAFGSFMLMGMMGMVVIAKKIK